MSTIKAVLNINNQETTIAQIRDYLIRKETKLKLLWVPSHIGIESNTKADEYARSTVSSPLLMGVYSNKADIKKGNSHSIQNKLLEKWSEYNHIYKDFNESRIKANYPIVSRRLTTAYIRFRLGHTIFTHEHIFKKQNRPRCSFCNQGWRTVRHITYECKKVKTIGQQHNLPDLHILLKNITAENINMFNKYLKLMAIKV
jgi:hypothetical protein